MEDRYLHNVFYQFTEPTMIPTFFPTYKKKEDRKQIPIYDLENWWNSYRSMYKVPWYKKGPSMQKRIPGFCDRIVYYLSDNDS